MQMRWPQHLLVDRQRSLVQAAHLPTRYRQASGPFGSVRRMRKLIPRFGIPQRRHTIREGVVAKRIHDASKHLGTISSIPLTEPSLEDAPGLASCHYSLGAKDSGKKRGPRVVFEPYSLG